MFLTHQIFHCTLRTVLVEIVKEITENVAINKQLIVLFFVQEYVGYVVTNIQDKNSFLYF